MQGDSSQSLFTAIVIMFLTIGVILMVLSVLGCVAALVESRVTLLVYYSIVLVTFIVIMVCVVCGYTYRSKVTDSFRLL